MQELTFTDRNIKVRQIGQVMTGRGVRAGVRDRSRWERERKRERKRETGGTGSIGQVREAGRRTWETETGGRKRKRKRERDR